MPIHFILQKNLDNMQRGLHMRVSTIPNNIKIIERAIDIHLHQSKRLKALHDAKNLRVERVMLRKEIIESQKVANYRHEYDRVVNNMEKNIFHSIKDSKQYDDRRVHWDHWIKQENPYNEKP